MESRRARNRRMKKNAVLLRILFASSLLAIVLLASVLVKTARYKQPEEPMASGQEDDALGMAEAKEPRADETQEAIEQAKEQAEETLDANEQSAQEAVLPEEQLLFEKAQEKLAEMSVEEKVAQLFFITPEALTGVAKATAAGDTTKAQLEKYPVGGLIYFAQNFVDPAQTKEMLTKTQEYALQSQGLPLFLGVDEEGGDVLRIGNNAAFQVDTVGRMGDLAQGGETAVYEGAKTIAMYLSEYGLNVNFAPDADVLVNESNQVIGKRSFGDDPEVVKQMAAVYTRAMHEQGILACYKHFPGHGGTTADSHTGAVTLDRTMEQLREEEFIPFADASAQEAEFVMVSHIALPKVTGDTVPASVSANIVTGQLRGTLGYDGIVITDALNMGAISTQYDSGQAVIMAIKAGCDMVMMPKDFKTAYEALLNAVDAGEIDKQRIDESVIKILTAKIKMQ